MEHIRARDAAITLFLSDAIEDHAASYQTMVVVRHQDSQELAALNGELIDILLAIDGLQSEK